MRRLPIKAVVIFGSIMAAVWGFGVAGAAAQDTPDEATEAAPKSPNDPGYVLENRPGRYGPDANQCIFFRTLYDWKPLNDSNLIVWAPSRNNPYLIQLNQRCSAMRFTLSLGFYSRDSNLCPMGGDAVIVDGSGGRPERCGIGGITKLNEESLQSLLDQASSRRRGSKNEAEKDDTESD